MGFLLTGNNPMPSTKVLLGILAGAAAVWLGLTAYAKTSVATPGTITQ